MSRRLDWEKANSAAPVGDTSWRELRDGPSPFDVTGLEQDDMRKPSGSTKAAWDVAAAPKQPDPAWKPDTSSYLARIAKRRPRARKKLKRANRT